MKNKILLIIGCTLTFFSLPSFAFLPYLNNNYLDMAQEKNVFKEIFNKIFTPSSQCEETNQVYEQYDLLFLLLNKIKYMLLQQASTLNPMIVKQTLVMLKCAKKYHIDHNNILTIIDYSLPSNKKRLWIFDITENKLLFHTYVSHGIKSGELLSQYFSNKYNSKASSIGVYTTNKSYYGRQGISLRLTGLERNFNDNAENRAIVMHGGWYVNEKFIKKYGRPGRSWGCPAVPRDLAKSIIDTIKDKSLFVVYYPSDHWLVKSKFLNCNFVTQRIIKSAISDRMELAINNEPREEILFADLNKNQKHEENEPIAVMPANTYEQIFHTSAPLTRMLRRQINQMEYIALSKEEFNKMLSKHKPAKDDNTLLETIYFVKPEIKMIRGYYATEMKIVNLGKIKDIQLSTLINQSNADHKKYILNFEQRPCIDLCTTNSFIRWLGL